MWLTSSKLQSANRDSSLRDSDLKKSSDEKRRYLLHVLEMHPSRDAVAILHLRSRFLGLDTAVRPVDDWAGKMKVRRAALQAEIDLLRSQFWTLPAETLRKRAQTIDVSDFPELETSVERLRSAPAIHNEFAKLRQHPKCQITIFNTLRRLAVLSSRDAGMVKEAYLRSVSEAAELANMQSMVHLLRSDFPSVYQMEADWLSEISRMNARKVRNETTFVVGDITYPDWYLGIPIVIFIATRILIAVFSK